MKLFLPEEANELLPIVSSKLVRVQELYEVIDGLREQARAAAGAAAIGGGMRHGGQYVEALYRIGKMITEIAEMGVEIRDPRRGLIDFPSMRGDRVVFLCWQLGDGDEIVWWHETENGFLGRKPL